MGITDKVSQVVDSVHTGAKNASTSVALWVLKSISAFVVAITLSMIAQELIQYGTISFIFVLLVATLGVGRLMAAWSFGSVLIFDLVCVLMALLLRMYIQLAP